MKAICNTITDMIVGSENLKAKLQNVTSKFSDKS